MKAMCQIPHAGKPACSHSHTRLDLAGASLQTRLPAQARVPQGCGPIAVHLWICLGTLAVTCSLAAASTRPDLTGAVRFDDGAPVTNATVFIYTAGPKEGSAVVCPSCYPDCGKKAKTDARGSFNVVSLDPKLRFRLLVLAPGCEGQYVEKVDPAEGPKNITIKRLDAAKMMTNTRIVGMVMNPDGDPLAGAVISPEGVSRGGGGQWGGTDRFVDPLAVSDEHGRFWLYCTNGVALVHATVEGRGVAKRWVDLKPGRDHLIRMASGVIVRGNIQVDGQPLTNVIVGLVTVERMAGENLRCDELATDGQGRFLIPNVPPDREFVLYAKMDSMRGRGAPPTRVFHSGKDGGEISLGELAVKPACVLSGRLVLSDGAPIPAQTRLSLGREKAWDHTEVEVGENGRFEFENVPEESVSLSVRIKGYKFSKRNPSLDWLNGGIVGRVTSSMTDLVLLMEPGTWRFNGEEGEPPGSDRQPRDKPLRSAKL